MYGRVVLWTGNCQPVVSPGACKKEFVSRTIHVREIATIDDMSATDRTYLLRMPPLVATGWSDPYGFFIVGVPPGTYSVFVEDGGREYCNWLRVVGGVDYMCPVEIGLDFTDFNIEVDHASW